MYASGCSSARVQSIQVHVHTTHIVFPTSPQPTPTPPHSHTHSPTPIPPHSFPHTHSPALIPPQISTQGCFPETEHRQFEMRTCKYARHMHTQTDTYTNIYIHSPHPPPTHLSLHHGHKVPPRPVAQLSQRLQRAGNAMMAGLTGVPRLRTAQHTTPHHITNQTGHHRTGHHRWAHDMT